MGNRSTRPNRWRTRTRRNNATIGNRRTPGLAFLFLILALMLPPFGTALAADTGRFPEGFTAVYTLTRGGLPIGLIERRLERNGDGVFVYHSYRHTTGLLSWFVDHEVTERSTWRYVDATVRPLEYTYHRESKGQRHVKLLFDWNRGRVTNIIDNDPWTMSIPPRTQDKLIYQLALMGDLQQGRRELTYPVADGGLLKTYRFEVIGREPIDTSLGRLDTIKVKGVKGDLAAVIWCAEALHYLPVRIERKDDQERHLRLSIDSLEGMALP